MFIGSSGSRAGILSLYRPMAAHINLEIERINLDEHSMTVRVMGFLGYGLLQDIFDPRRNRYIRGQPPATIGGCDRALVHCSTLGWGQQPIGNLSVTLLGYSPHFAVTVPISLLNGPGSATSGTLDDPGISPLPVDIPFRWDPLHFPSDTIALDAHARVSLPTSLTTSSGVGSFDAYLTVTVADAAAMPDLASQVSYIGPGWYNLSDDVELVITRNITVKVYTYAISLVPLILAIILLHLSLVEREAGNESVTNFLLSLAAAMLTVLPLRAVLIPSDVQGITRVDLILGSELLLLTAVGALRYVRRFWR